jgi:glutathione S-transferase
MYKLYSMQRSGNSYKVRLALALLNAPYHAIEVDILRGESRTPEFLAKNPSGQVPLLEVGDGRYLAESNAILWYVAGGTSLAPESRIERAEALQWMFFEQHALEPNIGAAFFWLSLVKGGRDLQTHALEDWMERGYAALQVMENHLKTARYFAADQLTVADIALYGYTHVGGPRPKSTIPPASPPGHSVFERSGSRLAARKRVNTSIESMEPRF